MKISSQLSLPIYTPKKKIFANFCIGDNDILIKSLLQNFTSLQQRFFYLWGVSSSGKTHILQASCAFFDSQNKSSSYIPLTELHKLDVAILENLHQQDLVVLDDIDVITGKVEWETAVFNLYNKIKENNATILMITSYNTPSHLNLTLKDLISRLNWGEIYQVKTLNDEQKLTALQIYAKEKGFHISDEVASFIIRRIDRDMAVLLKKLDLLDEISLQEKRKLTIPFIKKILSL